jgi:hypothetical protein
MVLRSLVVAMALVAATVGPAAADETYRVEGEADASGSDPRIAALDVAFARATREALSDLVTPADLKAHRAVLDRELIGRARKWASSYKVISDTTEGDLRKLTVAVKIDRVKLTTRLTELGIAASGDAGAGDPVGVDPDAATNAGKGGKKATVLLVVTTPRAITASYGAMAERDVPGLSPVNAAVRGAGWQLVSAPASGPAPRKDDGFLDDDSARALAGSAGADLAVIVAVAAGAPGEVRGTADRGVLARARIRVVDRNGGVVGEGTALAGARGTGEDVVTTAIASAAVDAFADARPAGAGGNGAGPVSAITPGADEILVRITARDRKEAPPWAMVRHIRDKLVSLKGAQVGIRRLAIREVVIGVRGSARDADKIARDVRDLERKITDTSFATKVNGNVVEVRVSGSP